MDYTKVFTPDCIADLLVLLCNPYGKPGNWLEPSAGRGAIAFAIRRRFNISEARLTSIEPNKEYFDYLWNNVGPENTTFEEFETQERFDFIVANPPFENDMWFDHLVKMYSLLKDGGTMVSIVPMGPLPDTQIDRQQVQDFIDGVEPEAIKLTNWYKPEKYPIEIIRIIK